MSSKSSLKAFREKIARIQDELRERIENECTGFDNSPEAVKRRREQVSDPVTGFAFLPILISRITLFILIPANCMSIFLSAATGRGQP